jgi:hypothetical protein
LLWPQLCNPGLDTALAEFGTKFPAGHIAFGWLDGVILSQQLGIAIAEAERQAFIDAFSTPLLTCSFKHSEKFL